MAHTKSICPKCGGSGIIRAFMHIDNGVCYACGGKGEYKHPVRSPGRGGLFEVVNKHAVWQFRTYKECFAYEYKQGEKVMDMMVQAITGAGRSGKTLFRIRLRDDLPREDDKDRPQNPLDKKSYVAVARRIYAAAMEDIHPDELTDEWLGFTPGRCQITRNGRGVDFL